MQAKVCITTPKYSMYSLYLHLHADQGLYKYTSVTPHTPTYSVNNSYLHLYAGQGLYKYT
jgi:hypothetical protein